MIAVRTGNPRRQERAEVLVVTDDQPFDGAVLALGHEEHVEQAENSPAAQTVYLSQDPVFGTGLAAEAHGDHLERCGHRCPPRLGRNVADGTTRPRPRRPAHPRYSWAPSKPGVGQALSAADVG